MKLMNRKIFRAAVLSLGLIGLTILQPVHGAPLNAGGLRNAPKISRTFNGIAKPTPPPPRVRGGSTSTGTTGNAQPGGTGGGPRGPRWKPPVP